MISEDIIGHGIGILETEIDDVLFQTNTILCNPNNVGSGGSFWLILQMCIGLAAVFAIIMAAIMAFKMMTKKEPLDVLKLLKPLLVSIVLCLWYPGSGGGSILDAVAYIPNCIGSYTRNLYLAEALNVEGYYEEMQTLVEKRDTMYNAHKAEIDAVKNGSQGASQELFTTAGIDTDSILQQDVEKMKLWISSLTSGITIGLDKLIIFIALVLWRIGWWSTIYGQQILLGMLTIFGPIQWAFSLLPRWEGSWAKWLIRYLTAHFYGAMLYFVGFYVLLLFDVVLGMQIESLTAATESTSAMISYMTHSFLTSGYLLAAAVVGLKCLNFVPDLAAWMIPEGDTIFSTRSFGEGVAGQIKTTTGGIVGKGISLLK